MRKNSYDRLQDIIAARITRLKSQKKTLVRVHTAAGPGYRVETGNWTQDANTLAEWGTHCCVNPEDFR